MSDFARLVGEMADEEWRMHAALFGGTRFALFPLVMLGLAASGTAMLLAGGADGTAIAAALHAFVLLIGIQTGGVAFTSREGARGLLGDRTLLLFSSRTLPTEPRSLVLAFLVKDVGYYAVLFMLPLALGLVGGDVVVSLWGGGAVDAVGFFAESLVTWVGLTVAFSLGLTVTLAGVTLHPGSTSRAARRLGQVALAVALGLVLAAVVLGAGRFPALPRWPAILGGAVLAVVLGAVGVRTFTPTAGGRRAPVGAEYGRARTVVDALGVGSPGVRAVAAGTVADLARSSGGLGKVVFSAGITAVAAVAVVDFVRDVFPLDPLSGLVYGLVLGLLAFPTYSWLTRFDALADYLYYPLEPPDVFRAKGLAFVVVHLPIALGIFALVALVDGVRASGAALGLVALLGVSAYNVGLLVALAGFDATEFLFDPGLFLRFWIAVSIVLLPPLVVGLTGLVSVPVAFATVAYTALAGVVGVLLLRRRLRR